MAHLIWAWIIVIPAFVISIVFGIIPGFLLKIIGLRKAGENWTFWWARTMAGFVVALLGIKVHVSGDLEGVVAKSRSGQPLCLVSNHTSLMDIPVLVSLGIRCGFVAKTELRFVPGVNVWVMAIHSVFINRNSLKKGVKTIQKAIGTVKKGCPMCIFPEGSRSKDGQVHAFRHGSFRLATESGATIVPVTIKGLRGALEDRKKFFQTTNCRIDFGVGIQAPASSDRDAVSEMITSIENGIRNKQDEL